MKTKINFHRRNVYFTYICQLELYSAYNSNKYNTMLQAYLIGQLKTLTGFLCSKSPRLKHSNFMKFSDLSLTENRIS